MGKTMHSEKPQATKYLSFTLNDEDYAIELSYVKEIQSYNTLPNIKPITAAPNYLKGMIAFQDTILSIVDMRLLYGFTEKILNDYSVIIVLNLDKTLFGFIVDTVCDIIAIEATQIKSPPDFVTSRHHHCVKGVGVIDERLYILLDAPKMIQDKKLAFSHYLDVINE